MNKLFSTSRLALFVGTLMVLSALMAEAQNPDSSSQFILEKVAENTKQESNKVSGQKSKILNRKASECQNSQTASECLNLVLQATTIETTGGAVEFLKLAEQAGKKDISAKKLTKAQNFFASSNNILLALEKIDLTQSWLGKLHHTKPGDQDMIQKTKKEQVDLVHKLRDENLEKVSQNVAEWKALIADSPLSEDKRRQSERLQNILDRQKAMKEKVFNF